jgi:hypothetical protein
VITIDKQDTAHGVADALHPDFKELPDGDLGATGFRSLAFPSTRERRLRPQKRGTYPRPALG